MSIRNGHADADPGARPGGGSALTVIDAERAAIAAGLPRAEAQYLLQALLGVSRAWLIGHDGEPSADMKAYLAAEGLHFGMASARRYLRAMAAAGFVDGAAESRNAWYRAVARGELERLKGPLHATAVAAVGGAYVEKNIRTWTSMQKVLDSGEHCPTHLRGSKPAAGVRP